MKRLLILALLATTLFACTKDGGISGSGTSTSGSFSWTENGGTAINADSAFWSSSQGYTSIGAAKGGAVVKFYEINWAGLNSTSVGVKNLGANNGDFTFGSGSTYYINPSAATLNVTAFANNKLSGTFTVAAKSSSGTTITLVATFTDLGKK